MKVMRLRVYIDREREYICIQYILYIHCTYILICIYAHTFPNIDASLPVSSLIRGCAEIFPPKKEYFVFYAGVVMILDI